MRRIETFVAQKAASIDVMKEGRKTSREAQRSALTTCSMCARKVARRRPRKRRFVDSSRFFTECKTIGSYPSLPRRDTHCSRVSEIYYGEICFARSRRRGAMRTRGIIIASSPCTARAHATRARPSCTRCTPPWMTRYFPIRLFPVSPRDSASRVHFLLRSRSSSS